MAVGDTSLDGFGSYLGIGRETTYGTLVTATSFLDFISSSLKLTKERRIIEEINTSRTYTKEVGLSRTLEGEIETHAYAENLAFNYLLQNAMGGSITSASATGDTAGSGVYEHTYDVGSMNLTYSSLSINMRKGQASGGKVFEYYGLRVNECMFTAEIDEPLKVNFGLIGKDATQTSNDISAQYSMTADEPLSFVSGRVTIVADTLGAATTTSYWHVQSVEFGIANNLKGDTESRRIGSETLDVLPPGIANFTLNTTLRFNTTTAYAAMLAGTNFAAELEFTGSTLTGSTLRRSIKVQMPKLTIAEAGDPEIGGPDEILSSQVTFNVLRDVSSAGGYAFRAIVRNKTASY